MSDDEIDETLGGFIVPDKEDSSSESEIDDLPDVDAEVIARQEAEALTANLQTTTVNGRTLRDRTKIQAPKDAYWERFGKKTSEKLAQTEHKREMLDDLKAWKKEFSSQDPDFVWKVLTLKQSVDDIEAFHKSVIDHFEELRDNLVDDEDYESPEEEEDEDEGGDEGAEDMDESEDSDDSEDEDEEDDA
jgi:hypothetical protein